MDPKLTSVIERVQKLLTLSKSDNEHEAANAAAAANKLIDQFRLSEDDLTTDEAITDPMVEDPGYLYETGRITPWKNLLIHVLTQHYGVAHFNDVHYPEGRKVSRYKLVGRETDIQIVRYMFAWLSLKCTELSDHNAKGRGHIFVASYCEGFVNGVAAQLRASRQEVQQAASVQAIIKLDGRLKESQTFMYSTHKNLKKTKAISHAHRDVNAFSAGHQQGKNVHLGKALSGSKIKLLKG